MIKQFKLLTILGSIAILGGVSTFAVLGTSCGGGNDGGGGGGGGGDSHDETWPVNAVEVGTTVRSINFLNKNEDPGDDLNEAIVTFNNGTIIGYRKVMGVEWNVWINSDENVIMDIFNAGGGDTTFTSYNNDIVNFNAINGVFTFANPSKVTNIDTGIWLTTFANIIENVCVVVYS